MFGGEIPDLASTPCLACGDTVPAADAVWDPYHQGEPRWAALPYHRACAGAVLPPATLVESARRCGLCGEAFAPEVLAEALSQLQARFRAAAPSLATPTLVWRLAAREPARVFVAEHFACLLARVTGGRSR